MPRRRLATVALVLGCGIAPAMAMAHPHVFVDVDFSLRFGTGGLEAVQVVWRFDDVYSGALLPDYLKKGEHQLSPAAVARLNQDVFSRLAPYRYYTDVAVNGVPLDRVAAQGFTARVEWPALVFAFTVPMAAPVGTGTVDLLGFDPEYFIEFSPVTAKPVALGAPYRFACQRRRFRRDTEITGPIDVSGLSCTIG